MRAQGQVKVSQLSSRLIAVKILDAFTTQSPWDLVYTNKSESSIWEYTNGSCLQGPHRSNRLDALALNTLLMYCQGFSHVTQFTSWEDLYTPIKEPELKLLASFYFPLLLPSCTTLNVHMATRQKWAVKMLFGNVFDYWLFNISNVKWEIKGSQQEREEKAWTRPAACTQFTPCLELAFNVKFYGRLY